MRRTWLTRLIPALLPEVLLSLVGCTPGTASSGSAATTTPPAAALGSYKVASRALDLTDASRVTDPTPDRPGDETQGRHLPTTLWYPSSGRGPFPIVVFSHGVTSYPKAYSDLLSGWASAGFVVAAPTFPLTTHGVPTVLQDILNQPADVSFVLTQVLALNTTAGDPLEGRIDGAHIAAAGHSGGAITTLGLLNSCCADPRITAAVVLAGSLQGFGSHFVTPGVPVLFEHGANDNTIPIAQGRAAYDAYPGPKAFVRLSGEEHARPFDNRPPSKSFPTVLGTTTDFLRWALYGDTAALTAFHTLLAGKKSTDVVVDGLGA